LFETTGVRRLEYCKNIGEIEEFWHTIPQGWRNIIVCR